MMKKLFLLLFVFGGLNAFSDTIPTYTVKSGNTLSRIASKNYESYGKPYGIDENDYVDSLVIWNNLPNNGNSIKAGDKLVLVNPNTYCNKESKSNQGTVVVATDDDKNFINEKTPPTGSASLSDGRSLGGAPSGNSNGGKGRDRSRGSGSNTGKDKVVSKDKDQFKDSSFSWFSLLIGLFLGASLGIAVYYFFVVRVMKLDNEQEKRDAIRKHAKLVEEKAEMSRENSRLKTSIQNLEKEKKRYFEENISLGEKIESLRAELRRERENATVAANVAQTSQTTSPQSPAPSFLYADAIIDDYFVKTKDSPCDDSIFVLRLEGEESAVFNIYKQAYQRVVANPSFLEGCEKQILGDSMQLEVISEGRAQREVSNGKWKVVSRLNVIIK